MKRDMDFIRSLLLDIEANDKINGKYVITDKDFGVPDEDLAKVQYHLRLLFDADYLRGVDGSTVYEMEKIARDRGTHHGPPLPHFYVPDDLKDQRDLQAQHEIMSTPMIVVERITWSGHEFIDTVRDDEVWRKTKEHLDKVGNFGIEGVKALAKGFLKKQVENYTGIELEF